ncbi:unhealthy ribosome biogenesis protein 2 homolog [Cyclopterus lumpus]|uniref:URB2 ribosome biogenesis homolog n=1 Tax=Cyclopterus lumpus TaxID=8103 RepID=A0A8C2ZSE7_CYCLU|nr:unhealthy ribosome biogenesis protein 2 homolog [Cyclopterus lumpus]XP_034385382.1 unhealthy ribosome biogenesis protein 2 homolog [Cyclopterus lumpus]XP_034385383.1 unhealthy ribosome biogenesis protein 2 homolog [Cyclopterus lumpus]
MAAFYSGIHLKLKSSQTPWEDKLKLARFAWVSSQCLLPNKEQVLLDWCTHALTRRYNQKVEFSQNVLEGLWFYLDDLLHSRKLHSLLKQGKTISLRLNMAQLLLDRLQECARVGPKNMVSVSTILSVCQGLLSSPVLSSVFTTQYELIVDLLVKLCTLACRELQQPLLTEPLMTESITRQDEVMTECLQPQPTSDLDSSQIELIIETSPDQPALDANTSPPRPMENIRSANLFEVLLQVLSCYLSVQRQQANPNRVFTMVTNQLIQPLILLRHLLTSGEFATSHTHLGLRQQLSRDIRIKIDAILQLALFPSEHLTSYTEELLPSKIDSGKRGPRGAKGTVKPVSAILSKLSALGYCELPLHYAVKSNTLSLLYKLFLESYAKKRGSEEAHRMLCFYFLTRLVPALEVCLDGQSPSPANADQPVSVSPGQTSPPLSLCSPESWSLALLALESLLSQSLSADIYNVAADKIRHEEVQLRFYRALAQTLFNQVQPSIPAWYRCLKMLLCLNHLILEPDLDQLLSSAWVNSECIEARVQRARQLMVCSLLQTYTKLRQLPHLFSELLSVICQPALDDLRPLLLSESVSASLRTCLLDTPASQSLEICSLVLESIKRCILPGLVREAENMEIDGGGNDKVENREIKVDLERDDASMKLFSLSHMLHVVLFSLKTLDTASPLTIVRQSQGLMEVMQQVAMELLHLLSTEKKAGQTNIRLAKRTPGKGKKNLVPKESETASEFKVGALWEQKTQEAALLLRYTWVEVDTLFSIHCSKYRSLQTAPASQTEDGAPVLTQIKSLLSGEVVPACLLPSRRPMSCLLLKLLTLQQMKKALLDTSLLSEPSTAALLNTAAQFILAKSELEASLDGEQVWDGQIASVNANSNHVAHWHLVTSNLPLIVPYLSGEDVGCVADKLVNSLLNRQTNGGKARPTVCLTVSLISSQLLQSPVLAELPSLFSATMCSLTQWIVSVLKAAHVAKACPTLLKFQEKGFGANTSESDASQPPMSTHREAIVQDILASSKTGEAFVLLTAAQSKELVDILQILTNLNPDGMNSEDLSSIFLLLLFMLASTSSQLDQMAVDPAGSGDDALFLLKLLKIMTCLLEGRNFQSVLKLIHGGTLLQASVSSLLWQSSNGRFQATSSSDWLDFIKAVQSFIRSLVQLIINRNRSVRLNLEQFVSYLTSKEMAKVQIVASSSAVADKPGASISSVHILLASLTSFSQAMTSALGRSKPMDQTLTQMLTRMTASLGPAVESVLQPQTVSQSVIQPACILGQAFMVDVVTVMLHCELSSHSVEDENKQNDTQLALSHMTLYRGFCHQILKEISCAHRPLDFLVSSLHFLSAFYKAVEKTREERDEEQGKEKAEKELNELYMQILQNVHRLLTASWLSENDVCELEPAVQELLRHLVEKSTTGRFNLLLLMIREGLVTGKLRAGNYREVLSAAIITKLVSCCQLPEPCAKALWLIAPQIISAMVFLVKSSTQDASLTLPFTVPTVTSMTSLLRQGEGLISNPHHVTLVLGALQLLPLDHLTPSVYQAAFLAVHEALFAIIQCHPQVILNAAPSFLNVFYRLVASIMQEGRQRGDSDTEGDVYLQCSRLIERMYSHIAATAESFTKLSAFMVAQYVTELQKVTLRPDVKLHLTEGIYRILDLCGEQDIKFLVAGLQMGVRVVFNELYTSYTHYHKAQRQGEEKYTV